MKKVVLVNTLLFLYLFCAAQSRFSIFAGAQVTSAKYRIKSKEQPSTYKPSFQAGVGWKIPFDEKLFFAPLVYYSLKGYKVTFNDSAYPPGLKALDNNTTIHAIDLVPMMQYDFGNKGSHFFVRIGAGIDVVFSGREKFSQSTGGTIDRPMKFSFADYGYVTTNAIFQLGYESASGIIVYGHYDHGLSSLNNADGGPRIQHRIFGISAGKFINKKKQ